MSHAQASQSVRPVPPVQPVYIPPVQPVHVSPVPAVPAGQPAQTAQPAQPAQSAQPAQPTFINMPQPPSNADTPSEPPGTPTSTTTSLSAVSTTAMKDGQRGGHIPPLMGPDGRRGGHQHHASTNSLEAERADRISRLTGLSSVSTLRPSYAATRGSVTSAGGTGSRFGGGGAMSPQTTPTSSGGGFPSGLAVPGPLTPAFFDAQGQPVAITKMSTVGTASATDSVSGRTLGDGDTVDNDDDDDDDILSMGTNYHYSTGRGDDGDPEAMMLDDDNLDAASRSAGGYEDRMSDDDGSASLVGFGEGAGSTVSGPIYHRRPLPPTGSSAAAGAMPWTTLERTNSGLSDMAVMGSGSGGSGIGSTTSTAGPSAAGGVGIRREFIRTPLEHFRDASGGGSGSGASTSGAAFLDSPASSTAAAIQERRDARLIDGMATDGAAFAASGTGSTGPAADDDVFIDTTIRGPVPVGALPAPAAPPPLVGSVIQAHPSALRETQRPRSHQQQQQQAQFHGLTREREAAEQIMRSVGGFDDPVTTRSGGTRNSANATHNLSSPGKSGGARLGRFYFEDRK